ncbi:hypothetical protein D3C74_444290 [compost metagenome]
MQRILVFIHIHRNLVRYQVTVCRTTCGAYVHAYFRRMCTCVIGHDDRFGFGFVDPACIVEANLEQGWHCQQAILSVHFHIDALSCRLRHVQGIAGITDHFIKIGVPNNEL